jgi:hypothetical protein
MRKRNLLIVLLITLSIFCSNILFAGDVTLIWDPSIDAPYLQSYRVFYYPTSGDPDSLASAQYASSYTLASGETFPIASTDPKSITIPSVNTKIKINGLLDNNTTWYFVVTAIDTRGLESVPTAEISTVLSKPSRPKPPGNPKLELIEYIYTYENGTVHIVKIPINNM